MKGRRDVVVQIALAALLFISLAGSAIVIARVNEPAKPPAGVISSNFDPRLNTRFYQDGILAASGSANNVPVNTVLREELVPSWQNWSWLSTVDFESSGPSGNDLPMLTVSHDRWGALWLRREQPLDVRPFDELRFSMLIAAPGQRYGIQLYGDEDRPLHEAVTSDSLQPVPTANTWGNVIIPLSKLTGSASSIRSIVIQDAAGVKATLRLRDVRFSAAAPAQTNNVDYVSLAALSRLQMFTDWLEANNARGYIAEVGWPNSLWASDDWQRWNTVGERWYRASDLAGLWVTNWGSGYLNHADPFYLENLAAYFNVPKTRLLVNTAGSQSPIVEAHPQTEQYLRGTNLRGLELGMDQIGATGDFWAGNPGKAGADYFLPTAADFAYLAGRGIRTVRIPFSWERLQPVLGGELDPRYLAALRDAVEFAAQNGQQVIFDLHNFGRYRTGENSVLVIAADDSPLGADQLIDVWVRLSNQFRGYQNVAAYGIMNEPNSLDAISHATSIFDWNSSNRLWTSTGDATFHDTDWWRGGGGALSASQEFGPTRTTIQFRENRNAVRDLSRAGRSFSVWVFVPFASGGNWLGSITLSKGTGRQELSGEAIRLVPGQWVEVTATFEQSDVEQVADLGVRIESAGARGKVQLTIDDFRQGTVSPGIPTGARRWEQVSQRVVDAIRANNDLTTIAVSGYGWSTVATWSLYHPAAWIRDPANRIVYQAQQYFDGDDGGWYRRSFDGYDRYLQSQGYALPR